MAASAGATIHSGVQVRSVQLGGRPTVAFTEADGTEHEITSRIIVGADGRRSLVRAAAGLQLHETPVLTYGGGMLVAGGTWPEDLPPHLTDVGGFAL